MNIQISALVLWFLWRITGAIADATDYNTVNNDGSFSFGLKNSDDGGHYHTATGNKNKVVTGRYGSRNPANRKIEETKYTAGPRGFRPQGPNVQRKFDQSQAPSRNIGTIHDPLADPYEDPSYQFGFRLKDQQRQENANQLGQVNGLYSYLDDVGDKHIVRYAAGAGTGFEVLNAVPDSPASVNYNAPLFKTALPTARGKIAFENGPNGQYKFTASGPDQRRAETTGPDGITRGSYSYLDDKNVQRTVQYIAGAGIGYKIIKNVQGAGTHILPGNVGLDYQITPDDYNHYQTIQNVSPSPSPLYPAIIPRPIPTAFGGYVPNRITPTAFAQPLPPPIVRPSPYTPTSVENNLSNESDKPYRIPLPSGFAATGQAATGQAATGQAAPTGSGSYEHTSDEHHNIPGLVPPYKFPAESSSGYDSGSREHYPNQEPVEHHYNEPRPTYSSSNSGSYDHSNEDSGYQYNNPRPFRPSGINPNVYHKPAYGSKIPFAGPNHLHGNEPRVLGKWYPVPSHDANVRAHIQSIDVSNKRAPSPGDALRRDEESSSAGVEHRRYHQ